MRDVEGLVLCVFRVISVWMSKMVMAVACAAGVWSIMIVVSYHLLEYLQVLEVLAQRYVVPAAIFLGIIITLMTIATLLIVGGKDQSQDKKDRPWSKFPMR